MQRRDFLRFGALATVAPLVAPTAEYVRKFFPVGIDLRGYNAPVTGLVELPQGWKFSVPGNMMPNVGQAIYWSGNRLAVYTVDGWRHVA